MALFCWIWLPDWISNCRLLCYLYVTARTGPRHTTNPDRLLRAQAMERSNWRCSTHRYSTTILVVLPINPPAVTHKIAPYAYRQGPRIQACSQDTILPVVNHKFASSQL